MKTVGIERETGRYEVIETRSDSREVRVRSIATGRYKWIMAESLTK